MGNARQASSSLRANRVRALALLGCGACVRPATEVVVRIDSNAPVARALSLRVAAVTSPRLGGDAGSVAWIRGGTLGTIDLPATFGLSPASNGPRDATVVLTIDADLAAGGAGEPEVLFRRIARFAFTPGATTLVSIFLAVECGQPTTGCTDVTAPCTVSERCIELGATCGDLGSCVPVATPTTPIGPDANALALDVAAASPDAPLPSDAADGSPALDALDAAAPTDAATMDAADASDAADVSDAADALAPPDGDAATGLCARAVDISPGFTGDTVSRSYTTCGQPDDVEFGCNAAGTPEFLLAVTSFAGTENYQIAVPADFTVGVLMCPNDCHHDGQFGSCASTVSEGAGVAGRTCYWPVEHRGGGCGAFNVSVMAN